MAAPRKAPAGDHLPAKHLVTELGTLRSLMREILETYAARLDSEVVEISEAVKKVAGEEDLTPSHHRDIRDMLTHLRSLQTKPQKGRRKDIKKIDDLIGELHTITEKW